MQPKAVLVLVGLLAPGLALALDVAPPADQIASADPGGPQRAAG